MNLIELAHKNDILQTYEIYKHCMFMPTEEKFNKKVEQFLNNNSVKIFACFSHGKIVICSWQRHWFLYDKTSDK